MEVGGYAGVIVVAGNVTLDDVVLPDGRTHMGTVGGDVFYSGLGAALWGPTAVGGPTRCRSTGECHSEARGEPVGVWSRVGEDFPAEHLVRLREAGLDTSGLRSLPGPTIRNWVLYEWDGRRRFIHRTLDERFPILSPEPDDLPVAYAAQARAVHVAALPLGHAERLVRYAAALPARPLVTLDTHEDFVAGFQGRIAGLLPLLAAFLPSREEVASWFGEDDPERYVGDLLGLGPGSVVIKMGAEGSLVQSRGMAQAVLVPAVPAAVQDVTGAGDAFCGGFVARLVQCGDVVEAARAGAVAASFAVEGYGSLSLVDISIEERDRRLATLRGTIEEECG